VPEALSVRAMPTTRTDGAAELRFAEVFKLPVGPRGLEPSGRLRDLDGSRVRIVGYMVARESAAPGQFILSPVPVLLGDEDESFSDDLPASAIFVHLPAAMTDDVVPNLRGLMQVVGVLRVGAVDEADGRVSAVHIELAESMSRLLPLAPRKAADL
jgi:hypothetical protein